MGLRLLLDLFPVDTYSQMVTGRNACPIAHRAQWLLIVHG
uniref:Uncharacterized protein n=1 Tax=Picea glauca TaxID=3330 RepID=A0A117NIN2_PICGL|nr:hypothetical protein ABT39_MTgene41 [Picea glauca]QHR86197.1 hypothetical protein Q903MT_gene196 [Picea sitchensis]